LLTGLEKENFELSEDKVSQEIASFGRGCPAFDRDRSVAAA
jgi:hypothetical protein